MKPSSVHYCRDILMQEKLPSEVAWYVRNWALRLLAEARNCGAKLLAAAIAPSTLVSDSTAERRARFVFFLREQEPPQGARSERVTVASGGYSFHHLRHEHDVSVSPGGCAGSTIPCVGPYSGRSRRQSVFVFVLGLFCNVCVYPVYYICPFFSLCLLAVTQINHWVI